MSEKEWAQELRRSVLKPSSFLEKGWISKETFESSSELEGQLQFRVPRSFDKAITSEVTEIAKQFVPDKEELIYHQSEIADPIGDEVFEPVEGITHRYSDRVLLKPTHQCAVYCRFCFRRERVSHSGHELSGEALERAINYIRENKGIREVIFSGGDPLTLTNKRLAHILDFLAPIQHVKLVRFHTRVPTVLPSRITDELISLLRNCGKTVWIVAHINSHKELSPISREKISKLADSGIPLLQQGVLLKGVNDSLEKLLDLFWNLIELRIKPYYLHYPDLAHGTSHFRLPLDIAISLYSQLRGQMPGYGIPGFVVDIPRGGGKVLVDVTRSKMIESGLWEFTSPVDGKTHVVDYR